MAEPLVQAASRLAECCSLLAIGYNLKQSGILRSSDGETALKVATTLTLPSVIVQALGNGGPLGGGAVSLLGVATVCIGAQLAATWLYCGHRSARERAVLAGTSTGLSLRLYGYPLVECFLGGRGAWAGAALQGVALVDLVNHVAVWIGSYLLFAGAGPAFPASFKHEDGGDYRGQWRGLRKEGLGVYAYGSGARYEGEWRDNVKEGRGVYYYPKGGVYEGEWSGGAMNGLGVRTLSTGQVKAGRWRDGQLESPLELWQVALAADGAAAVAAAARSVEVGGGRLVDAAHQLAAQPTLWALLGGLAVNVARVPLPTSVDLVTGALAQANAPLMLLAAGITAPVLAAPQGLRQLLPDISRLLGSRLLVPLAVGLNLVALLAAYGSGGGGFSFRVASASLVPLVAAVIALLTPVPPQALANARRFRLNESTAAAITTASHFVCVPLMLLAGVAAAAAGLAAPPPGAGFAAAAAATSDVRPLGVFLLAAVAAVSGAVGYVSQQSSQPSAAAPPEDRRVLMVYAGPPVGTTQGSPSAATTRPVDEGQAGQAPTMGSGRPAGNSGSGTTTGSPLPSAGSTGGSGGSGSGGPGGVDSSGGTNTGGAASRRPPPAAAALPPGTASAAAPPPPRGAASCWAARSYGCCGVRRGLVVSRVACAAAAAACSATSAPTPTPVGLLGGAMVHRVVACCGGGAAGFGALTSKGPRCQPLRAAATRGPASSLSPSPEAAGSRREVGGVLRLGRCCAPHQLLLLQRRLAAAAGVGRAGAAFAGGGIRT